MLDHANDVAAVGRIDAVPTILETVARVTGMRFAAIARVTDQRWIACSVRDEINLGLVPGGELDLRSTICHEIRTCGDPVFIEDVVTDPVYAAHHTPSMYGFRSYVSVPIRFPDGQFFGTLCALDPEPRRIGQTEIELFGLFAEIIGAQLDQADRLSASEASVVRHVSDSELREQFIAVIGHDLRNPLASVQAGVTLLRKGQPAERTTAIMDGMQTSLDRMAEMIANILDFARGRLGDGLTLQTRMVELEPLIEQVVDELRRAYPNREIVHHCTTDARMACDPMRIAQLLSNLLGNALTHGAIDRPVEVTCAVEAERFTLSVSNGGAPITPATMERLFHPFSRGQVETDREGLGLGLYIASQIAQAHGGKLSATSDARRTCFTFEIPTIV
ncbi:GAF domain-containing sensor histidine kinase [Sphingomonas sp. 4RDLI-65]|uniref:GAF domain-containing sensor histidine kinase n=1 Tax=Sphingomonas sp. 4RDLI-65 TaxID=3111641 RepID=UPI003C27CC1B